MLIQQYLIRYILHPLARIVNRLSQKLRDILFVLGGMGIVVQYFMQNMGLAQYRFLIVFAIDCVFLGIMILSSLSTDMRPVKFRWPLAACWFGVGLLMLLSGIINNVDYLPEAMLILVAYPVIFICWNNCDRTRIFELLLTICKLALILFVAASFFLARISPYQYAGIFSNVNGAAYFLAVAAGCMLLKVMYAQRLSAGCVTDMLLFGLSLAMMYYTNSRTGPLGIACALVAALILYMLTHPRKENLKCLMRLGISGVFTVICVLSLVYVFQLRQEWDIPYLDSQTGTFYSLSPSEKPSASKPDDAADASNSAKPGATNSQNAHFGLSGFQNVSKDKTSTGDKDMDQYSTGRISIWKKYASELNWLGHESVPKISSPESNIVISTTHMTILEIAYESGIPAGILYLAFNILSGVTAIWFAWKNKDEKYALMPLVITLVFGVLSMLGSCNVSLWFLTTLYYYLTSFPIIAYLPEES